MKQEIVRERRMFALAEQLEARLTKAHGEVDVLTPSLPPSPAMVEF